MIFYAHSIEGKPTGEWQPLDEHLLNVAEFARSFAEEFRAGKWGYLSGLWHDLGKYSGDFQKRLGDVGGCNAHIKTQPDRADNR